MKSICANITLLLLGISGPAVHAAAPRDLIAEGNAHYAAGRYAEALESYQQAAEALGGASGAELLHDQAAAQFKLGNLDEARELWVRALPLQDPAFEARTRYNLGNCDYAAALQAMQAHGEALSLLERAMAQYCDAIRLDPSLNDARANLELAHRLKQELERNATTRPQSQPSQRQDEQSQNDQQQPSSQPSPESQPGEGKSDQPEPTSQPTETQPQPREPQTQPSEPSTQPDQEVPQTQPAEPPPPQQEQSAPQDQPATMIQMTREEAERLLQMIRDAEKARRRVLREREAGGHQPVDRDW